MRNKRFALGTVRARAFIGAARDPTYMQGDVGADRADHKEPPGDRAVPAEQIPDQYDIQTSIVLPVYNERGNLRPLIEELQSVIDSETMAPHRPVEILLVDDGSTDGSTDTIQELADKDPRIRGLFLTRNFGQSAALHAGFDHARGKTIVTLDADGQNNPNDIPRLLDRLEEGFECVSGWRRDRNDPITKTVPSAIQTYLAKLTGPDINDFGCTLKAYRAEAVKDLPLQGENHRYIPAMLYSRGYRITEEPVDHRPRTHGASKYGWTRLLRGLVDLGYHVFRNRYGARPMHFLGGLGLVLVLIGGLIGGHAVVMKYAFGEPLTPHLPRLLLVIAMLLFGLQLLTFGIIAEMLTRLRYRDERPYRIATTTDE